MLRTLLPLSILVPLLLGCAARSEYVSADTLEPVPTDDALRVSGDALGESPRLVTVRLPNLAPPGQVRADCDTYVAWVRTADGRLLRAGEVRYDGDAREGRVALLTGHTEFVLLVTAEPDPEAGTPRGALVVRRSVSAAVEDAPDERVDLADNRRPSL